MIGPACRSGSSRWPPRRCALRPWPCAATRSACRGGWRCRWSSRCWSSPCSRHAARATTGESCSHVGGGIPPPTKASLGSGRIDGLLLGVAADLDALGAGLLRLGQRQAQHAVGVVGADAVAVDALRHAEAAHEAALPALAAVAADGAVGELAL